MSELPDESASRLPVLVGVTGKRVFAPDKHRNDKLLAVFCERFDDVIVDLDRKFPRTPKVLLCGGASGVDLAALRTVLERNEAGPLYPGWSAVVMLPFELELFQEDFDDDPEALRYLRETLEHDPRVTLKWMRRLRGTDHASLSRRTEGRDAEARQMHYEQLGLWIARHATILVAGLIVTPDEEHKPGGTARVIAFRRTGIPDALADAVISRSLELPPSLPLEEPDGGSVLLIDPARDMPRPWDMPPVEVLRPLQTLIDIRDLTTSPEAARKAIYASPAVDPIAIGTTDSQPGRLAASVRLPSAFEAFHQRQLPKNSSPARPEAPRFGDESPPDFLARVREGPLGRLQTSAALAVQRRLRRIVGVFLCSILIFEMHIELFEDTHWLLFVYCVLLIGTVWIARGVSRTHLQRVAEDYRGLREMMRVQIALWDAGIPQHVDRFHLRTTDSHLRLVREAASAISIWAVVRRQGEQTCDPIAGRDPASGARLTRKWVQDQVRYFARNAKAQRDCEKLSENIFHIALSAALICALALALALLLPFAVGEETAPLSRACQGIALTIFLFLSTGVTGGLLALVTGHLGGMRRIGVAAERRRLALRVSGVVAVGLCVVRIWRLLGVVGAPVWEAEDTILMWSGPVLLLASLAVAARLHLPPRSADFEVQDLGNVAKIAAVAMVTALILVLAIVFADPVSQIMTKPGANQRVALRALVLIQTVLILAVSGMVRFYSERRNHAAQANQYDDMFRVFRRAQDLLPSEGERFHDSTRQLMLQLGQLALHEGEAWLKAHRERPPEPPS